MSSPPGCCYRLNLHRCRHCRHKAAPLAQCVTHSVTALLPHYCLFVPLSLGQLIGSSVRTEDNQLPAREKQQQEKPAVAGSTPRKKHHKRKQLQMWI